MASTERIETSYRYADGVTGGHASELWLVKGVDSMMAIGGQSVGLPKVGDPHPINPSLLVRERTIETIIDPQTTTVRVDYRQASFDLGMIYSTSQSFDEPTRLHLIYLRDDTPGVNGIIGPMKGAGWDVLLYTSTRKYTVNAGGSVDAAMTAIIDNRGRWYELGAWIDVPFILIDGQVRQLKNGQVIAEYSFQTHRGFPAIPLDSYPNQAAAVPACPPAGMVSTYLDSNNQPRYIVQTLRQRALMGKALPGMPQR